MSFMELAKNRFSTRKFTKQQVEKEKLDQIVEAGRIAPTAANNQPQRIYIIRDAEKLAALTKLTPCVYGAPTVLMVTYDTTEDWQNPLEEGVHDGVVDAAIVGTHMMLEATDLGLGTCWVGYFPPTKTAELFHLPKTEVPVLLLPVGYTAPDYQISPKHYSFKPYDTIVKEL